MFTEIGLQLDGSQANYILYFLLPSIISIVMLTMMWSMERHLCSIGFNGIIGFLSVAIKSRLWTKGC